MQLISSPRQPLEEKSCALFQFRLDYFDGFKIARKSLDAPIGICPFKGGGGRTQERSILVSGHIR